MKPLGWHHRSVVIGAIVFNVTLIHAAGLVLLNQPQAHPGSAGASGGRVVQMRLAKATTPAAPAPMQVAMADTRTPDWAAQAPDAMPTPAAPEPTSATPTEAPPHETLHPFKPEDVLSDLAEGEASTDARPAGDEYLPRPQLSAAPRPTTPVIVPFPKEITTPGRYTVTLALFIDETGVVRRVLVDGPAQAQALETAARDTFLNASFSPGQVNGQAVKSLIRVEVAFDNSPIETVAGLQPSR